MYYSLHVHPIPYTHKPDARAAASISKTIVDYNDVYTPEQLAQLLGDGHTVVLGLMNGTRSKNNLISQQVMMLDFDNTVNGKVASGDNYVRMSGCDNMRLLYIKLFLIRIRGKNFEW